MKIVTDTNVLFAAFVSVEGTCAQLVELVLTSHTLALSQFILQELRTHLSDKKRLGVSLADRQIAFLASSASIVDPVPVSSGACSDPGDLPVLGTLLAAGGDCLVSGDRALLELRSFSGHPILSPGNCWTTCEARPAPRPVAPDALS